MIKRLNPFKEMFKLLEYKMGYSALIALLLQAFIISGSLKWRMTLQERLNRERISIGLANYSLK